MRRLYFLLVTLCILFVSFSTNAQVTGIKNIPGDYPSLAAAITALNTNGVGAGGATINIAGGYTETAPFGGFVLGSTVLNASLSSANQLIIKKASGVNPLLTAWSGVSSSTDGIFILQGCDYVTIDGINLNDPNTGVPFPMEWGYALLNLNNTAPFDGCQNVTIKNCTITMNRLNPYGSYAIYANHHTATNTTPLTLTSAADAHSNNKFYSNTISNSTSGICMFGFADIAPYLFYDQNNDVGGNSSATGNTLTNLGGNPSANLFGISLQNGNNGNVSYNTLDNAQGGVGNPNQALMVHALGTNSNFTATHNNITVTTASGNGVVAGVYGAVLGSGNTVLSNNNITFVDGVGISGLHYAIFNGASGIVNINNNTVTASNAGACSYPFYGVNNTFAGVSETLNNNVFQNFNLYTTGTLYFMFLQNATPDVTISGNTINNITRTGSNAPAYGFKNGVSPGPTGGLTSFTNNTITNIFLTGQNSLRGFDFQIGGLHSFTISGNNYSNWNSVAGELTGFFIGSGNANNVFNNTVSNFTTGYSGTMYGLYCGPGTTCNIHDNKVSSITNGGPNLSGVFLNMFTTTTGDVYRNKINDITSNGTSGTAYGMNINTPGSVNVYNNYIGNIYAPASTSPFQGVGVYGINIGNQACSINLQYNTIYLSGTSGGNNFGSAGIFANTTPTVTLRNNLVINLVGATGSGKSAAYRRSSATLTTYGSSSNNNMWFAGGNANNVVYYDGAATTNPTLSSFQATVAPRDANSVTESATPFLSTVGANANFLHLNASIPTVVESGGANIPGFTDDYDGDLRNGTTPDIGADEFNGLISSACSGTPTAGTITGNANLCLNQPSTTLTVSGFTASTGVTIQWQSSTTSGGPYTDIAGATGPQFITPLLTAGTYYYVAKIICSNGGAFAVTPQFVVTVNSTPIISISPLSQSMCLGGAPLTMTATGGATYTWSPAAGLNSTTGASVTANPTATTVYTVTGTSAAGCSGTGSATINIVLPPIVSATSNPVSVCMNGSGQLQATGSVPPPPVTGAYNLTPLSGQTYTPLTGPGITIVTTNAQLTQGMGATTQDDGGVVVNLPFTFSYMGNQFTQMTMCTNGWAAAGNWGTIDAASSRTGNNFFTTTIPNNTLAIRFRDMGANFGSGFPGSMRHGLIGTDVYAFQWDQADGNSFSNTNANLISFMIKIYGPASTNPGRIEYIYGPLVGTYASGASIGIEDGVGGTSHYLNALSGDGISTLTASSWPGNGNGYRFDPIQPTFSWSPSTFLNATNIPNPVASNMTSSMTYTITASANGCSGSTTLFVPVGTPLTTTAATTQATMCSGTSITLSTAPTGGGGPYTYSWSNGTTTVSTAQSFTVSPTNTSTFTVTVTDACSNTATASVNVTVNTTPTVTVTPSSSTVCNGATIGMIASGAPVYLWTGAALNNNSGANVFATPTSSTTYTVTGYTPAGCSASATATITVNPALSVSVIPNSTTICTGGSIGLSGSGALAGGYIPTPITYNPIATPGTGVTTLADAGVNLFGMTGNLNDGGWINQNIGFTFNLYGVPYTQFAVGTNGFVYLGGGASNTFTGFNFIFPSANAAHPCIGALYSDLDFRTGGTINYFVSGTAPNRMLVINWLNGKFSPGVGAVTTQAILYEGTDIVEVHTLNSSGVNPAVEGVQNAAGTTAAVVSGRNASTWTVTTPDAYRWTPPVFTYTWSPSTGLNTTSGVSVIANPTSTTTYIVSATETQTGCKAYTSKTVLVNQNPTPTVSPANPVICKGDIQPLTATSVSSGATFTANSTAVVLIPDNNPAGVNNTIAVSSIPAGAIISNVQVVFNITHSNDQDLIINLKGPNGQVLNLVNARGGSGDNFASTNIGSAPNASFASGTVPFTGVFSADAVMGVGPTGFTSNTNNFASLFSAGTNGNWTLAIQDANGGEVGALSGWSITVNYLTQDATVWSPLTDLYIDAAATTPYSGTNLGTVYAKPSVTTTYTVTGSTGCNSGTGNVILNVNQPPAIANQPITASLCQGQTATFTVGATGAGLTYQWYFNSSPLSNGGNVSGATSATLTITNIVGATAGDYYVIVGGSCNPSPVTSSTVHLTVGTPPIINSQPVSQTACAGNTMSFSVVSPGTNSYQWYKGTPPSGTALVTDGTHIFGATTATLTITNITAADAGNYYVVVSNGCNFATTSVVGVLAFSTNDRWLGVANSDWNNPNNWCNGVPTPTTDVEIPVGTLFPAIITVAADVRNLQINSSATLTVASSGYLNIWGSTLTQNGIFNASLGTISFRNTANLNIPVMTIANVVMNGSGGITMNGNLKVDTALTLTNGNITIGNNNLIMRGGTMGSVSSHIVTNGTGAVTNNNVGVATVVFPVGASAITYNPLQIANGQGLNYTTRVAIGVPGTLFNANRAINRTWTVTPSSTPASPVQLTFNYADADGNTNYSPATNMEAGYFNGASWIVTTPAGGVAAMGTAAARQVYTTTTTSMGTMVVSNVGGLLNVVTGVANLNTDIFSVKMLPNIVDNQSVLRVNSRKAMNVEWTITDLQGRVVMKFNRPILSGQNDINLKLGYLASGSYQIVGYTDKGTTNVIQFVRL